MGRDGIAPQSQQSQRSFLFVGFHRAVLVWQFSNSVTSAISVLSSSWPVSTETSFTTERAEPTELFVCWISSRRLGVPIVELRYLRYLCGEFVVTSEHRRIAPQSQQSQRSSCLLNFIALSRCANGISRATRGSRVVSNSLPPLPLW